MKFLFIVQGEGRGHMTQAISLHQLLEEAGHEVCQIIVGKSNRREIPKFFYDNISAPIEHLDSPNFVTDKKQKSVKPVRSVIHSIINSSKYQKSILVIHELVEKHKPDVIINFYDFLGGLYNFSKAPKSKFVCLAHQYLIIHPSFDFPRGRKIDRASLRLANRVTSLGADKTLALSFQEFQDLPAKNTFVTPPLLRKEIKELTPTKGNSLLIYMVNSGYSEEVKKFHNRYPDISLDCFWDKSNEPETLQIDENLTFHQLNDKRFIEKMAHCKGYLTTAGFESVCEAMYLGKPTMMVPVRGHYEQACNAIDAVKAGAGIANNEFDLQKLSDFIPNYKDTSIWFQDWTRRNTDIFLQHLTQW